MTIRWIWIVLASLLTVGCGEVTVSPFVEASDAGVGIDGDAGQDADDAGPEHDDGGPGHDDDGGMNGDDRNP